MLAGSPHGPDASFTPASNTFFTYNAQISLVSTSTAGSDGNQIIPITSTTWSIDMGNDGSGPGDINGLTGTTQSFTATPPTGSTGPIQVGITLTVTTGPNGQQPTTDSEKHVIVLTPPAAGLMVDIYTGTNNPALATQTWVGGKGNGSLGAISDTFGPQELITLNANVTYNGVPVAQKDVRFDIVNNQSTVIGTRTGRTNDLGVASIDFRLPWENQNPDAKLGQWRAIATVEVSQNVSTDFVRFNFNYTMMIQGITANLPEVARDSSQTVMITAKSNMLFATLNGAATMVVYDVADVPVAHYTVDVSSLAAGASIGVGSGQTIAKYAFAGVATAYGNLLTSSDVTGVPYCPEKSVGFSIKG
jgi:hypothetical protein